MRFYRSTGRTRSLVSSSIVIHIATIHWNSARWIAPQQTYLRQHLKSDFRVYGWLNTIPDAPTDSFYYVNTEPVGPHAVKLNILADVIHEAAAGSADDIVVFLDGDAFPITNIEPLLARELPTRKLIAVQRFENNGDIQPHPCFCATTVGFWREIKGDWKEGYRWKDKNGREVTDVGANLLARLADRGVDWLPLRRTNKTNLHPLLFGIYGDAIYHHGAGFRTPTSRSDWANVKSGSRHRILSMIIPGYKKKARQKLREKVASRNETLSERVFESILNDPQFYRQFM
jgi:hypothetical protein